MNKWMFTCFLCVRIIVRRGDGVVGSKVAPGDSCSFGTSSLWGITLTEVMVCYWHGGNPFLGVRERGYNEPMVEFWYWYFFIEGYSSLSCVLEFKLLSNVFNYGNHTGQNIDYFPTMLVSSIFSFTKAYYTKPVEIKCWIRLCFSPSIY